MGIFEVDAEGRGVLDEVLSNRAVAIRFGIGDRCLDEVRKRIGLPSYVRGRRSVFSSWE